MTIKSKTTEESTSADMKRRLRRSRREGIGTEKFSSQIYTSRSGLSIHFYCKYGRNLRENSMIFQMFTDMVMNSKNKSHPNFKNENMEYREVRIYEVLQ